MVAIIEYVRIYLPVNFITVDNSFVLAIKEKNTNHLKVSLYLNNCIGT